MIFYLKPPSVLIDLKKFSDTCFSRLNFFMNISNPEQFGDIFPECLTPGTRLDSVGHFILRCFCIYNPTAHDFILERESRLFMYRLEKYSENAYLLKEACKIFLKDVRRFRDYKEPNPVSKIRGKSFNGSMLFCTLKIVLEFLLIDEISQHFRCECKVGCHSLEVQVPFQMCASLVSSRSIEVHDGFAFVPCSLFKILLVGLFKLHFKFGLLMIQRKLQLDVHFDERWIITFKRLNSLYQSYITHRAHPIIQMSAKGVDMEKEYFPPCMSHLLGVLRHSHRLSYNWRYRFSLFLKDIGLNVHESIDFWKSEYSKSCSSSSKCQHSWKDNQRKYTYSIRHIYGLEGRREPRSSKTCYEIQNMSLGVRDEGGCPFMHFDEAHLLKVLDDAVIENEASTDQVLKLSKENRVFDACRLHLSSIIATRRSVKMSDISVEYESPLQYYIQLKTYVRGSTDW